MCFVSEWCVCLRKGVVLNIQLFNIMTTVIVALVCGRTPDLTELTRFRYRLFCCSCCCCWPVTFWFDLLYEVKLGFHRLDCYRVYAAGVLHFFRFLSEGFLVTAGLFLPFSR